MIYVEFTATEYSSFEDSEVMTVTLKSDPPTNINISVTVKLTPKSASGIALLYVFHDYALIL